MAIAKKAPQDRKKPSRVTPKASRPAPPTDVTDVSEFKKERTGGLLVLPSGKVVEARAVGMEAFISSGMIPNELMPLVQAAMLEGKPPKDADIEMTPALMSQMVKLFDDVTMYCVTRPQIFEKPEKEEDRQEELLYIDEIAFDDKSFIYQFAAGGTRDVKTFRDRQK